MRKIYKIEDFKELEKKKEFCLIDGYSILEHVSGFTDDKTTDINFNQFKKNSDTSFLQSESFIKENCPHLIVHFYVCSFILSYHRKKLKSTLWSNTYPQFENSTIAHQILFKCTYQYGLNFLDFCRKWDDDAQFFQTDLIEKKNTLLFLALTAPRRLELKKYINILDFIQNNPKFSDRIDYQKFQEKINAKKIGRLNLWHISNNPYLVNEKLTYSFVIKKEKCTASLQNYCIWCSMNTGIDFITNNIHGIGLDGEQYRDMTAYLKTYLKNEFINNNISDFIKYKVAKAKKHHSLWLKTSLELLLQDDQNGEEKKRSKI